MEDSRVLAIRKRKKSSIEIKIHDYHSEDSAHCEAHLGHLEASGDGDSIIESYFAPDGRSDIAVVSNLIPSSSMISPTAHGSQISTLAPRGTVV